MQIDILEDIITMIDIMDMNRDNVNEKKYIYQDIYKQ